ncbi:C-type natriuretic peptide 3-like [Bombina bombina]|uniref:C-type natriuretic peptide 3-like n=1 Tax=Bombina bombina TaxID=8345 RepID=UPI00235AA2CB|nr:C-type natriuretic peptide 3-like [Bombina bombina]
MSGLSALTMTLLILAVSARPPPQLWQLKSLADLLTRDLSSSEEMSLLDSIEDLGASHTGPRTRESPLTQDSAQLPSSRAWLRLFSDFMNNQKKFRGRTKKSGVTRGCFGMKLERIGSFSGLGC